MPADIQLADPTFRTDPALSPDEQQVSIVGCKADDWVRVHAEVPGIARKLWHHPEAELEAARVDGDVVHAITTTLPVGVLKIGYSPRQSNTYGPVVSNKVFEE